MNTITEFTIDSHYSNDQIRFSLRVQNLGGIRPALNEDGSLRHIAIMTTTEKAKQSKGDNPYQDRIEGNILVYTASGREGDQILTGRNKRIVEQYEDPIPIFGFVNHGQQVYQFLGLLEVIRHYRDRQVDKLGDLRSVWIFEFRIHQIPEIVPIANANVIMADILGQTRRLEVDIEAEREVVPSDNEVSIPQQMLNIEKVRARLLEINPYRFEYLIKAVLEERGFLNVEVTQASGDGGIDLNAIAGEYHEFFVGTQVQLQAKRWRHAIGSVEINNFRGAMNTVAKGIYITTSHYTRAAIENANNPMKTSVTLIDGRKFSSILLQSGVSIAEYME